MYMYGLYIIGDFQARAEVNVQNSDGDTPLHFACQRRDATFAELLLNQGADPWQRHPGWDGDVFEVANGGNKGHHNS
jgi:ankyrin repeat protein